MVVTCAPATLPIGTAQERTARPSTCTVQAPHWAMPQPNFVPVSPISSRSAHNSGISSSTSSTWGVPFTVMVTMGSIRSAV